jgi:hypothetical protein
MVLQQGVHGIYTNSVMPLCAALLQQFPEVIDCMPLALENLHIENRFILR